jgi:hypothetical protein
MKKLLLFITLVLAIMLVPLHSALCEDAGTTDAGESEGTESAAAEAAEETAPEMAAMTTGAVETGKVGKAQLLSPLLSESFQTDLATGAATVSVPIVVPPGRKNMQPNLALSYSSNNPNGICGVGWTLSLSSIQRSTKRGTPRYDSTDTFVFSSSGSTGELIPINAEETEYRQKIETDFMKYTYDGTFWTVRDKNGTKYTFGSSSNSRIENSAKIFAWHLKRVEDIYGNYLTYIYGQPADGQIYLEEVQYTGNTGLAPDKSIVFIYEGSRADSIYNYRSGWKIETSRRLKAIDINVNNELKWKYVLDYSTSDDTQRSLLTKVTLYDGDPNVTGTKHLPPKIFTYQAID